MAILLIACSALFLSNIFLILFLFNKNKRKISNINKSIALINQDLQKLHDTIALDEVDFEETIKKNVILLEKSISSLRYEFTVKLIEDIKDNIEVLVNSELGKQKKYK